MQTKYGILEITPAIKSENNKWIVLLPGHEGITIQSKREVEILSIFKVISRVIVSDYFLEIGQLGSENYLIVKKSDILSTRGYDLIGVYSKDAIVKLVSGGLYIDSEEIKVERYQIRGNDIKKLDD